MEGNPAEDAEGMEGEPDDGEEADGSPLEDAGESEGLDGRPDEEEDEEADGMDADELDDEDELDDGIDGDEGIELEDCCWLVDSQPASARTATIIIACRTEYRLLLYIMIPCLCFRVLPL